MICHAIATANGEALYSLHFELSNQSPEPIALSIYEPFTAFSVLATAGGKPVAVHRPTLDIAVNPTTIRLPPNAAVTIGTPIQLRISANAEPVAYGFIWTVASEKETVSLQIKLDLPAPFASVCPVSFH
jgi:hypothetical protein